MRYIPIVAGILLGLLFLFASLSYFFAPPPPPPAGSLPAQFMEVFGPTGYLRFVKVCELLGGLLVAIPRTRNLGLLILGPIIINILAFDVFITKGEAVPYPLLAFLVVVPLYLLWVGRKAFGGLLARA